MLINLHMNADGLNIDLKKFALPLIISRFNCLCNAESGGSLLSTSSNLALKESLKRLAPITISREAVRKRMNACFVVLLKTLIELALKVKAFNASSVNEAPASPLFGPFANVYLEDSTTFSLPDALFKFFPGNYSRGIRKAVARLNLILELKQFKVLEFDLKSYTENDQAAAGNIVTHLKPSDLVIRDLGYAVLKDFKAIIGKSAHFLSRKKYGIDVFCVQSGKKINLLKLLQKKGSLDIEIELGGKARVPCRLVAIKLPKEVVNERIRKARKHRNASTNHSQEYFKMLEWAIFVTSVPKETWSQEEVALAYQVRWQIEIVFKSWKSHLNILKLRKKGLKCPHAVRARIYCALLFILLYITPMYRRWRWKCYQETGKHLSLIKLTKFINENFSTIMNAENMDNFEKIVFYCCSYEKRPKRMNLAQKYLDEEFMA